MRTTIDSAGRVVIPKPLREAAGLTPGSEVDIVLADAGVHIEVVPDDEGPLIVEQDGFHVIRSRSGNVVITDEDIYRLRDAVRR